MDGREYFVSSDGLVLGRDPTCDVVVPTGEVSRKHAFISCRAEGGGYTVTDTSTNGLLVNGLPVTSSIGLVRGDVITLGAEDFRFYADGTAPVRPVLATLQVKSTGLMQGQTFELRSPLTHIGRGAYNDVVLPDDSVSDLHAKVQLREGGGVGVVVDMGSTNGTYIGGRRIVGEARIEGAPDLRVGGIKFIFRPTGVDAGGLVMTESDAVEIPESAGAGAGHTRAIAALTPEQRARFAGPGVADTGASSAAGTGGRSASPAPLTARGGGGGGGGGSERGRGASLLFWVVVLVVAAIAVVLLLF